MLRIKKPVTFAATFLAASFVLFVSAQPLVQEGEMPSPKGKQHEMLAADAGKWDAVCSMTGPDGSEMEFKGTETVQVDCGGLWVFSTFEAEFMGMPFKGRSVSGYDTDSSKYVGAWVDSMTTRLVTLEGDMEGDALVMMTEGVDPATGETYPQKQVQKHEGPDKRVFEMFNMSGGKEQPIMKIVYTRSK